MEQANFQVAEITLTYRSKVKAKDRPQIRSSADAFEVLSTLWSDLIEFQEEFNILLLNRANKVLGIFNVSKGSSCGTVVDAKLVFTAALKGNAASIILAHNHPSGNLQPSQQDIDLTEKLKKAGVILEIAVLDHLIITAHDGYFSFADESMI
ncbi:MAG: JAB domain-containing protein [Saprospiraceae bacterium]|nr:JAB domain-containing protein [Saprospiraceae bacterium]